MSIYQTFHGEVSVGEAIDKLCILELKMKKIKDEEKKTEISKEIDTLSQCNKFKEEYDFYYNLLTYVNEKIWDMTDSIKENSVYDETSAFISNQIFEFNQKRFRIKNWFNLLTESNIKEQKSYYQTHCKILISSEEDFFSKLPEIHYLALEYDAITFDGVISTMDEQMFNSLISTMKKILKVPTIIYDEEEMKLLNNPKNILLSEFEIPMDESRDIYSFKPITYIIGGYFGDFIQTLSVVCEKFYQTGRKGIVYFSERGDPFRYGLEKTFNDTYDTIVSQKYIYEFKIYNNEPFDIDLASWRVSPVILTTNFYYIYENEYKVHWGKHKWLDAPIDNVWSNRVVINTTNYRFDESALDFKLLHEMYGADLLFISAEKVHHEHFQSTTQIEIEYYEFTSFIELITIINSCKLFVGVISGPLSLSHALHKNRICSFCNCHGINKQHSGFDKCTPNIRYHV